ncbi:helix-turn-helix domain-containing protein [Streptosporangium longisporum]|uniref:Helix-turn-helix domain-containing protein n=1 Tax=Streptosporangium longisporum TaxID=46187 RepID=A0ABP6LGL7_9ACTN
MRTAPAAQPKPLMKVVEVADLCEVDEETVRVWFREGKLKGRRTPGGRDLRFRRTAVYALMGLLDDPSHNENGPALAITAPDEP